MKKARHRLAARRFKMTIKPMRSLAALSYAFLFAGMTSAALAAETPSERSPTKIAEATQAQTAVADDDGTAACSKVRKRLWIEGEGWVVRRVTTCR